MAEKYRKTALSAISIRSAACTTDGSFCNIIVKYGTENCNTRMNLNHAWFAQSLDPEKKILFQPCISCRNMI
ncbi:MAG: hypothetical protein IKI45_08080 [Oscillospiraceae bacterium]|nr:hypothetical protein [Oscillospiraceae bacterium]